MRWNSWGISIVIILIISISTSLLIPQKSLTSSGFNSVDPIDYEIPSHDPRSIGELSTETFPVDSIIIPMDDKQDDLLKAFGFIHALLRNGTTIYRVMQPPNSTIKTSTYTNGAVYSGGPVFILPINETTVNTVHLAFQNVSVDKLTESFTSSMVYTVTEPTNILVIFGGTGNTDTLLDEMEIPFTMINRSYAENYTEVIGDPYTLIVVDCWGWYGYIPNNVSDAIRALVEAGGEAMFNCYSTQDMIVTFPEYIKGNLVGLHSEFCRFHQIAEFPAQYYGPYEMNFTNVWSELSAIHPDVRSVLTTNDTIYNDAAIYFPYGENNGVVVGTIFEPGNQPFGSSSRKFASTFYGNKFVHSPPLVDFEISNSDIEFNPHPMVKNNSKLNIFATIHNKGQIEVNNVIVNFYDGRTLENQIGVAQIPTLPAGGNTSVWTEWIATSLGTHEIFVFVDPYNNVAETNETNNVASKVIAVSNPDYVLWNSKPPPGQLKVSVGKTVQISSCIKNIEMIDETLWSTITFYNQSWTAPFQEYDLHPLDYNEISDVFSAEWLAPDIPGIYQVIVEVDRYNAIEELNENNNTYLIVLNVTDKPETMLEVGSPQYKMDRLHVTSSTELSFWPIDNSDTGIRSTQYNLDSGEWVNFTETGPFRILTEGFHTVYFYSTDNVGGVEDINTFKIIVDNTPPITSIDVGDPKYISENTWITSNTKLILNATDGGIAPTGINITRYRYQVMNSWSDWSIFEDAFKPPWVEGEYRVEYYSIDLLGNVEGRNFEVFFIDNTPPEPTILINDDDEYTNSTSVRLSLTAKDSGSGVGGMAFSDYAAIWSSWETFTSHKNYELPEGDGKKHVYFKVKDRVENKATVSDTIILDTTPPHSLIVIINDGTSETNSRTVNLKLNALDDLSGVSNMSFSTDGKTWSEWESFTSEREITLPPINGENTIHFRVIDHAGNVAPPVSERIMLSVREPTSKEFIISVQWLFVIIIIILIFIALIGNYILKRGKRDKEEVLESDRTELPPEEPPESTELQEGFESEESVPPPVPEPSNVSSESMNEPADTPAPEAEDLQDTTPVDSPTPVPTKEETPQPELPPAPAGDETTPTIDQDPKE
jgi:hypothetical protein